MRDAVQRLDRTFGEDGAELAALHELLDDIGIGDRIAAYGIDLGDAGVAGAGRGLDFKAQRIQKGFARGAVIDGVDLQQLERHVAAALKVMGAIDGAERAGSQLLADEIAGKRLVGTPADGACRFL